MIKKEDVKEILFELILDLNKKLDKSDVKERLTLFDLGFDSLDVVDLSSSLEKKFDISISGLEIETDMYRTIGEIVDFIYGKI